MKTIISLFILTAISAFYSLPIAKGYQIGDMVDDFKLQNIDGNMVSLSDYNNSKGVIVVFTCNTCPYAVAYEDRIVALDKVFAPKGYPVLAIMPNNIKVKPADDLSHMKQRAKEKGFTFEIVKPPVEIKQDSTGDGSVAEQVLGINESLVKESPTELGDKTFTSLESVLKILPKAMTGEEIKEKYNINFKINDKSLFRPLK